MFPHDSRHPRVLHDATLAVARLAQLDEKRGNCRLAHRGEQFVRRATGERLLMAEQLDEGIDGGLQFSRPGQQCVPGLVADGRDMGSVIFPDADLKIFLTASVEERARRRYKQLKGKGIGVSLPALSKDMADRDQRDLDRAVAPLQACPDAKILDTTSMSIEAVVSEVLNWATKVWH